MSDILETAARYNTIADAFGARLEGMAPEGWSAPTPCSEWTTRDLVAHVIGVHRRVIATLTGRGRTDEAAQLLRPRRLTWPQTAPVC